MLTWTTFGLPIESKVNEFVPFTRISWFGSVPGEFHFARAFKSAVGQSPHQYISTHRLERAKEMLMRGDQRLIDIAIALNFSSQANFTRAFRVATGMTPGRFRRDFAP